MIVPLPAIDGVESLEFELDRNGSAPEGPMSRAMQRQARDGDRWVGTLNFPPEVGEDAGVIDAFLTQASRFDAWMYLPPPQHAMRGAWAATDLVANGSFLLSSTTGWTAVNSALSINTRRMKVKNSGAASGSARQNVVMEIGKPHVLALDAFRGKVTAARASVRRQSDNVAEADSGAIVAPTRGVVLVVPTVAAMYVSLACDTAIAADDVLFGGVSLSRCLQVAGAGQVGNRLVVDGGPASTDSALKAGQFVTFLAGTQYQLAKLAEDFDTDAAGAGTLVIEPGLRASPADNAVVIVRRPFGRFTLGDQRARPSIETALFHNWSVSVVEDVTP